MNLEQLKAINDAIAHESIHQISITAKGLKVKLVKGQKRRVKLEPPKAGSVREAKETIAPSANTIDILSPQVGFFSRFNVREKKQYVKLRDLVRPGQIVGMIVSRGIHYEVSSERRGKILEFLVEEGQPVEFHQPLIRLSNLRD